MTGWDLQLHGTRAWTLIGIVIGGVALTLLGLAVREWLAGRRRKAALSLACLAGPIGAVPALLIDAGLSAKAGQFKEARLAFTTMLLLGLFSIAGVLLGWWVASPAAWWMIAMTLYLVVAVGVIYSSIFAAVGPGRLTILAILRILAIAVLVVLLFKPTLAEKLDAGAAKPVLVVLLDRSGSMDTADQPALPNRYRQAVQSLRSQKGRIEDHFRPQWITFAAKSEPAEGFIDVESRKPTGPETDATAIAPALTAAGNTLTADNRGAGVLLISDGVNNAPSSPIQAAVRLGKPVWTVGVGSAAAQAAHQTNLRLLDIQAPAEAVVNNTTMLTAKLEASRFANTPIDVNLYEEGETAPAASVQVWTPLEQAVLTARLPWTPKQGDGKNLRKLRIAIAPQSEESTEADNAREIHVLITNPRIRVLYIEGAIRPEYKFLRRTLQTDPNIEYMGLVRFSENRFTCQGAVAGKTLDRLPETPQEFGLFDVIIIGDLDRSFLTDRQLTLLRTFVKNGGGLAMLGGRNSFGPGGYGGTDLETVLPVVMGDKTIGQETEPFLPQLTSAGENHPIFADLKGFFPGPEGRRPDGSLPKLPELRGQVRAKAAKPTAAVLAVHPTAQNDTGPLVTLAAQPFGKGRTLAFLADTTCLWYMPLQALGEKSPYLRFWGQLIRYLARAEAKTRQAGSAALLRSDVSSVDLGAGAVKLTGRVQNDLGQPESRARVSLEIIAKGKTAGDLLPMAQTASPGQFQAEWTPAAAGKFTLRLKARDEKNALLGEDELQIRVENPSKEGQRLARDDAALKSIAQNAGGRFVLLSALPDLVDELIATHKPDPRNMPQPRLISFYRPVWLFILFGALLTTEWLLRRFWQLL